MIINNSKEITFLKPNKSWAIFEFPHDQGAYRFGGSTNAFSFNSGCRNTLSWSTWIIDHPYWSTRVNKILVYNYRACFKEIYAFLQTYFSLTGRPIRKNLELEGSCGLEYTFRFFIGNSFPCVLTHQQNILLKHYEYWSANSLLTTFLKVGISGLIH